MFLIAIEFFELGDFHEAAVDAQRCVAVVTGPVCQWFVVAFASTDEWCAEVELVESGAPDFERDSFAVCSRSRAVRRLRSAASDWLTMASPLVGEC